MHPNQVKKPLNRAAQDATLINLRSLKNRVERLEASHRAIELGLVTISEQLYAVRRIKRSGR